VATPGASLTPKIVIQHPGASSASYEAEFTTAKIAG
jgi:hypothetical protein